MISRKKAANLHSVLANKTLGLGTKPSFVRREVNSAALAHCSLSFHSHVLSPLLVWYAQGGPSLWSRKMQKSTLTVQKGIAWTRTLLSLVIWSSCSFLRRSAWFSVFCLLTALRHQFLTSVALTMGICSHSPSCILLMLV